MSTKPFAIDRRSFLGSVGMMAGAVVATSLVPLSVVHAVPAGTLSLSAAGPLPGNWHVDDTCGHWPPYAHPIGYAQPRVAVSLTALADPIDHIFLS
jgi:hypothetical protein